MSHTKYVFVATVDGVKNAVADNTISIHENNGSAAPDFQADGGAALVDGDLFQVVEKRYGTPEFAQANIAKVDAAAYNAGTAQVQTATIVRDGGKAEVKIIDVTEGREKFAIATFEGEGADDDAAAAAIATAISASTRDVFKDVTATASSAVITITSPKNKILRLAGNDSSTFAETQVPIFTVGTKADIDAEFEDALPFIGVTNIAGPNVVKPVSGADNGGFHRVSIFVKARVGQRDDLHEIVIYCDDTAGDALIGHLETVFGTNANGTISIS